MSNEQGFNNVPFVPVIEAKPSRARRLATRATVVVLGALGFGVPAAMFATGSSVQSPSDTTEKCTKTEDTVNTITGDVVTGHDCPDETTSTPDTEATTTSTTIAPTTTIRMDESTTTVYVTLPPTTLTPAESTTSLAPVETLATTTTLAPVEEATTTTIQPVEVVDSIAVSA